MPNLIQEQKNLYDKLREAIKNKSDITGLLRGISEDDFLSIIKDKRLLLSAIDSTHYKAVEDILNMAVSCGKLKEFKLEAFLGIISKDQRGRVIERLDKYAFSKAMKVGIALGVITALAVGGGCVAAGTNIGFSFGMAVAAALAVGVAAGVITYIVSKPSAELNVDQEKKPIELQDMNKQENCCSHNA